MRMMLAILLSCLMLNIFLRPDAGPQASDRDKSITYIGFRVGNFTMDGNLTSGRNNTMAVSIDPAQKECVIPIQEDNILNGTSDANPRDAKSEPRKEDIMLLFGSLIPIIGMPVLTIINDRHRSMVLRVESLCR